MSEFSKGDKVYVSYYNSRLSRREEEVLTINEVRDNGYKFYGEMNRGDEVYVYDSDADELTRVDMGRTLGNDVSIAEAY